MADMSNLADSAYEIINNTDGESQDGHLSESTSSFSASRHDDVHSLDGSEHSYDSESDDERVDSEPAHPELANTSHASIQYADEALQSPSTHISTHTLRYSSPSATLRGPDNTPGPIEFREDTTPDSDQIPVHYVLREHTEEESAAMAERLNIPSPPRRLVTNVRQTMSERYLPTEEPLRVFYVGHAGVMGQILHKISNAIVCENPRPKQDMREYNIYPLTFGDNPELSLMEASPHQIKVAHCSSACEFSRQDRSKGSPLYEITTEDGKIYSCNRTPQGIYVSPQWTRPHVAVFFHADDEDEHERRTRKAAWDFLKDMGVPSIVISETSWIGKYTEENWAEYVDERFAHLCLESQGPESSVVHQRVPIDLVSFTKINTRQMSRNLALLTGLLETPKDRDTLAGTTEAFSLVASLKKVQRQGLTRHDIFRGIERNRWFVGIIVPLLVLYLGSMFWGLLGVNNTSIQHEAVLDILEPSTSFWAGRTSVTTGSIATSTSTVVINVTSTKTVQIVRAMPSTSTVASALSFAGFLSDKPSGAPAEPKFSKTICSVEKTGTNEILIKIPSETKTFWLSKEAITIDVCRGEQRLKTKLSVIDEGMMVELERSEAYGSLNVSVVSTRRPKINETFEVDFGKPIAAEILDYGRRVLHGIAEKALASDVVEKTYPELKSKVLEARDEVFDKLQNLVTPEARDMVRRSQIFLKKHWIGLRFSKEDMKQYERKAQKAEALRKARVEMKVGQASSLAERWRVNIKQPRSFFWSKDDVKPKQTESKNSGWKKMIKG